MRLDLFVILIVAATSIRAPAQNRDAAATDGKQYALLVGCTKYPKIRAMDEEAYRRKQIELNGPVNDVELFGKTLVDCLGVPKQNIAVLAGWPDQQESRPTCKNIMTALADLKGKVKNGDRVIVFMAGHGARQPDQNQDELDGWDEIFLPADAGGWDPGTKSVRNCITDDALGDAIRKIRDAGAQVWLIMDCCHSGTMMRGPDGCYRRLDAADLVEPEHVTWFGAPENLSAKVEDSPGISYASLRDKDVRDIVAMYASQAYHQAPERQLPIGAKDAKWYGLFTFMLVRCLERSGSELTFEELHRQIIGEYYALPGYSTLPLSEGNLATKVHGGRAVAGPLITLQKRDGTLVLNAGRLHGIEPGTVLGVFNAGKHRSGEAIREGDLAGKAAVTKVEFSRSECKTEDQALGPALDEAKSLMVEVLERPVSAEPIRVVARRRDGSVIPEADLNPGVRQCFKAHSSRLALASSSVSPDWNLTVEDDRLRLEPIHSAITKSYEMKPEELERKLLHIYRINNLRRLAAMRDLGGAAGAPRGFDVELLRVGDDGKERPVQPGELLRPGMQATLQIQNRTTQDKELWVFTMDSDYGFQLAYPQIGENPLISHEEKKPLRIEFDVTDGTLGTEQLLYFVLPKNSGSLAWLAGDPLGRAHTRGGGEGGALGDVLEHLAFGTETTRSGLGRRLGNVEGFGCITYVIGWGEIGLPEKFAEPPVVYLTQDDALGTLWGVHRTQFPTDNSGVRMRGDLSELFAKVAPAVFAVRTATGHGAAFLVDKDGLVLTNHHVIDTGYAYTEKGRPQVSLVMGRMSDDGTIRVAEKNVPAVLLREDPGRDLALLKIVGKPEWLKDIRPISLAENNPKTGQTCVMLGHPSSGMLWTIREGNVSQMGDSPHDFVSAVLQRMHLEEAGPPGAAKAMLSKLQGVKIVLSSCAGNPGDSGGPLVDKDGRLLGINHAIPSEVREDKFVYHVHLEEIRSFLAKRPSADIEDQPHVPDPWRIGPNVKTGKTGDKVKHFDILFGGGRGPRQVLIDLDEDSKIQAEDASDPRNMIIARRFDAEIALHFHHAEHRNTAFYDTNNDGVFDLVLIDHDDDPEADVEMTLTDAKVWKARVGIDVPWLQLSYLRYLSKEAAAEATRKLKPLMR